VRAQRGPEGVAITWIRRSRREADAWEPVDVPLGEESERYELDILSGGAVVRTLSTAAATVLYPTASELADFGSAQAILSLRVYQLSAALGRGFERGATVTVT